MKARIKKTGEIVNIAEYATIEVQITEINDEIVYSKSSIGGHWANPEDVELISKNN